MIDDNPYRFPSAPARDVRPRGDGVRYVPLGWRTAVAAISVFGMTFMDVAMRLIQPSMSSGDASRYPAGAALAMMMAEFAVLLMSVCSWVFVPVWFYRASANLRGLGRYGMEFSPGGCAGWFFVPFVNVWFPPKAMGEIWRASDPPADEGSWAASSGTSLVALWWTAWLVSGFVSWASLLAVGSASAVATIGLLSTAFRTIAAVALVLLMRGVSSRQEQAATRLAGGA
jgi:hypothetical protein